MPEGDTIWRTAQTLRAVLAGRTVTRFESPLPEVMSLAQRLGLEGQSVAAVEPRGKHLEVRFSSGAMLHTHQGMHGSWHTYRAGSSWRKSRRLARVLIETAEAVAVCFGAPVVELLPPGRIHPALARLGPDILAPDFDAAEALRRLRERQDLAIGVALLDQTALAGIGNVYKSEVLFLSGVDPGTPVRSLPDDALLELVWSARRQMLRNLTTVGRRTRSDVAPSRLWVYGRAGKPCFRCGTTIRRTVQGEQARSTYLCPLCQPGPGHT